ncbi:MAG: hypothetical protein Q8928_06415 [Bacteroidota bacterium]|nr:hypothetical protein [Bacteroidota bacterium]
MKIPITPADTNYLNNFGEAIKFNQSLGLPIPNFTPKPGLVFDKVAISNYVLHNLYLLSDLQLEDVAQKCFIYSKQLQDFLKERCNINSIITSGCLFENGFRLFGDEKGNIAERLKSDKVGPPVKFHTWLTLENYDVVDITYPASLWLDLKMHNCETSSDEDYKKLVWYSPLPANSEGLCYKPLFLGYDYFERVKIAFRLGFLIKQQD